MFIHIMISATLRQHQNNGLMPSVKSLIGVPHSSKNLAGNHLEDRNGQSFYPFLPSSVADGKWAVEFFRRKHLLE